MSDQRCSDPDQSKRDIPSFIEPRPPLILNPFMRPRPQKGINLLELFEDDSESDEPEWVQVYLRLKPYNGHSNLYEVKSDRCLITSVDTAPMGHGRRTQHNVSKMYTFSHIFGPESSQKEIFEHVVKGNLKKLPEGHNFTLLTYGASGSGKTYTLMGTVQAPGLVPRSLEYVFRVVDAAQQPLYKPMDGETVRLDYNDQDCELQFVRKLRHVSEPLRDKYRRMSAQLKNDLTASTFDLSNRTRYYVWVSFVEIYNEAIYDLLSNCDRSKATSKLRIREDPSGNVYVKGARQAFVRSGSEAYDVLVAGKHSLQVAATGVHDTSSRSHCIFTITMLTETESGVRSSCVRLCDLAGCERAKNTKNTGTRMQESRAINSSLHVLERCLQMLRRKQKKVDATMVPYRESKLTRLLGAGLSGARGEAVSMVVSLNPAPQFAHETRHVLQLAAVAKDIQVNQTIAESSLEHTQDSTAMDCSTDVMRLRAENERLHFEIIQAQTRNKELLELMEEKDREKANTMYEIVEEAKDIIRQYYEAEIQALRNKMEEMQEDHENRLKEATTHRTYPRMSAEVGTPSRAMQRKVAELTTEIAILKEKLHAEKLARARAEEEVQHLRACIEERDAKGDGSGENEEVNVITDSEGEEEEEENPYNESLEPTFSKETINKSRLLQQSLMNDTKHDDNDSSVDSYDSIIDINKDETITKKGIIADKDESSDEDTENTDKNGTIKDNSLNGDDTIKDSTFTAGIGKLSVTRDITTNPMDTCNVDDKVSASFRKDGLYNSSVRGTYFVRDVDNKAKTTATEGCRSISNITDYKDFSQQFEDNVDKAKQDINEEEINKVDKISHKLTNKFENESNMSLLQFEQLEMASNTDPIAKVTVMESLKEKVDFDNNDLLVIKKKPKTYFDNVENNLDSTKNITQFKLLNDDRSPSIVKEDVVHNFEPSTIKKLLGESFTRQPDILSSVTKNVVFQKKCSSIDIFEGFDSPVFVKPKDVVKDTEKDIEFHGLEKARSEQLIHSNTTLPPPPTDISFNQHANASYNTKHETTAVSDKTFSPSHSRGNRSIFADCIEKERKETIDEIESTRKSIVKVFLSQQKLATVIKQELSGEPPKFKNQTASERDLTVANSFENICKDILANRAADFKLLAPEIDTTNAHDIPEKGTENAGNLELKQKSVNGKTRKEELSKETSKSNHKFVEKQKKMTSPKKILIKQERLSDEPSKVKNTISINEGESNLTFQNKTGEEFENICKDISAPRDSEFELLVSQNDVIKTNCLPENDTVKPNASLRHIKNDGKRDVNENTDLEKTHKSVDKTKTIESTHKSIDKIDLNQKKVSSHTKPIIKQERLSEEPSKVEHPMPIIDGESNSTFQNNTAEEFENIYKDISAPRTTEFELLVSQSDETTSKNVSENETEKPKYNLRHVKNLDKTEVSENTDKRIDKIGKSANKLAKTQKYIEKTDTLEVDNKSDKSIDKIGVTGEILLESKAKCESTKLKRTLRLRRRKNVQEDEQDSDTKTKDFVNLQQEFSDITLDVPAPVKEIKDIESPEKKEGKENLPPLLGAQSCPMKSIQRSRRKLFTPRAEPLAEPSDEPPSGDSPHRVRVPRPSYHRTRARRKL